MIKNLLYLISVQEVLITEGNYVNETHTCKDLPVINKENK